MANKVHERQIDGVHGYWTRRLAEEEERARQARSDADRAAYLKACAHLRDLIASRRSR